MTKGEAIGTLCGILVDVKWQVEKDAINMAIDALRHEIHTGTHESVSDTHDSDLISRADEIGAVQDHFNDDGFKGYDDGQKMMDRIKSLPSADRTAKPDYSYESEMVQRMVASADRPAYFVKCSSLFTREEFEKLKHDLKMQNENIVLLPPGTDIASRQTGQWIDEHEDGHGWWVGRCDQCGKENKVDSLCPNCGASMSHKENE